MRVLANHSVHPATARILTPGGAIELTPDGVGPLEAEQLDFVETLARAVAVCTWFGIPDTVALTLADLLAQRQEVTFLSGVVDGEREGAAGPLEAPYAESVPNGVLFGATTECALHLPDRVLACFIGIYGLVTRCEDIPDLGARITVERGNAVVEKLVVLREGADDDVLEAPRATVLRRLRDIGCARISNHRDPATQRSAG